MDELSLNVLKVDINEGENLEKYDLNTVLKLDRLLSLKEEINNALGIINKCESEMWSNGESLSNYIEIALYVKLKLTLANQLEHVNALIEAAKKYEITNNEELDETLKDTVNEFLLKYGYQQLTDNISKTYFKIDSGEFRFSEDYITALIDLIKMHVNNQLKN